MTGYDQYFALRTKRKLGSKYVSANVEDQEGEHVNTQAGGIKIKKVKASKVGNYLVITLVLSEQGSGDKVSIDDPALLLPLVHAASNEEKEESLL
ncbi:MAG: hypothetical protein J7L51_02220 [Desulfurococcales archaeon]|nr:hypothetical protein [Desulfurococcales archaeon]RLG77918.1 MAG: hypothetical protein DRO14_01680 [Thermoprotei archaeon]